MLTTLQLAETANCDCGRVRKKVSDQSDCNLCVRLFCQTGLIRLTGVRLLSQVCPETCQNGRCRDFEHSVIQELERASSMADRVN